MLCYETVCCFFAIVLELRVQSCVLRLHFLCVQRSTPTFVSIKTGTESNSGLWNCRKFLQFRIHCRRNILVLFNIFTSILLYAIVLWLTVSVTAITQATMTAYVSRNSRETNTPVDSAGAFCANF